MCSTHGDLPSRIQHQAPRRQLWDGCQHRKPEIKFNILSRADGIIEKLKPESDGDSQRQTYERRQKTMIMRLLRSEPLVARRSDDRNIGQLFLTETSSDPSFFQLLPVKHESVFVEFH